MKTLYSLPRTPPAEVRTTVEIHREWMARNGQEWRSPLYRKVFPDCPEMKIIEKSGNHGMIWGTPRFRPGESLASLIAANLDDYGTEEEWAEARKEAREG